jgi:hypothetical protein
MLLTWMLLRRAGPINLLNSNAYLGQLALLFKYLWRVTRG